MNITDAVDATVREYMHFWDGKANPTLDQLNVAGEIPSKLEALGKSVYCKVYDAYTDSLSYKQARDDLYLAAAEANDHKDLLESNPDLYRKGLFRALADHLETEFDQALHDVFSDEATRRGL